MTERADGQVTWSDLGLWSGKTCPERSAATKGKTSRQSSKRSYASQNRKPPILKCLKKAGTPGGATTMKWEDDGAWLGECMTRNTGESPNVAVVSRLSQILEETPQAKYSLSAKACQGILRRAERRGKDLPETLKAVLLIHRGGRHQRDATSKRERRAKSEFAKHHPNRNDRSPPDPAGMRTAARLSGPLDGHRRVVR